MPQRIEYDDPDGVDYTWVMQVTFLVTILAGVPIVALLSTVVPLATWTERALFAVRVGAVLWFVTAIGTFLYARRKSAIDPAQ